MGYQNPEHFVGTDCAIIGNYSTENFAVAVEINVWGTLWNWIYEAVFQIGEAGFKLFITIWSRARCNQSGFSYLVQAVVVFP